MAPVLIGLQLNVCSVELSVYCGPHCVVCPYPEDTWLVHGIPGLCTAGNLTLSKLSVWEPVWVQESVSLGSKVRATSFILLLGVGSFVCYRLFHQLKRRLTKGSKRSSQSKNLPAKIRKLSAAHRRYLDYLLYEQDDVSSLSNSDFSDTSSCASYGDGETTSDTPSLSDGDSDSLVMGVSSSNPFEPVYFSKASGIHFRGQDQRNSTPLDHLAKNVGRHSSPHKCHIFPNNEFLSSDHKENVFSCSGSLHGSGSYQEYQDFENSNNFDTASYEAPFMSHDAASMHGNFSPGSLRERTLRTEQLISSKLENLSKSSHHILKRDYSVDSLTYNSEQEYSGPASKRSLSRTLSIDSEVSELCVELQRHAEEVHEMGIVTVEKMENLEDEINDIKQTVLELDADLVGLKVYKKPPPNCWELTNITESDQSLSSDLKSSGVVDVVNHHKNKMWCKGLLDKPSDESNATVSSENTNGVLLSPKWDQVCNELLDWDVSVDNPFQNDNTASDSGSDFGNSLETDSPDLESVSVNGGASASLEWDTNFVSEFGVHTTEEVDSISKPRKVHHTSKCSVQSKSLQEEHGHKHSFKKKYRSQSIPSEVLSKQIQEALRKRSPAVQTGPMELSITPFSSSLPSPLTEVKTDESPMYDRATSLFSDMTFSSASASRSNTSGSKGSTCHTSANCNSNSDRLQPQETQERKDSNGNFNSVLIKSVNRDSAYCEDSDFPETIPVENVGPEVGIRKHSAQQESHQNAQLNQLIKKGYEVIEEKLNFTHIRRIKGDNYCIIRAGLYQMLSERLPILKKYGGAAAVYQLLSSWAKDCFPWLLDWTFADNLPYNNSTCLQGFWNCLLSLESMEVTLSNISNPGEHLATVLNGNSDLDVQLLEAVKLLMCVSACQLYLNQTSATATNGLPVFVMLLFARDVSPTPKELVLNRLNRIGRDHRLQQVEVYLLGYSLSVTLQIVRFSQYGSQEFITCYPDCNLGTWKEITLVAEDDAKYNVLTR